MLLVMLVQNPVFYVQAVCRSHKLCSIISVALDLSWSQRSLAIYWRQNNHASVYLPPYKTTQHICVFNGPDVKSSKKVVKGLVFHFVSIDSGTLFQI